MPRRTESRADTIVSVPLVGVQTTLGGNASSEATSSPVIWKTANASPVAQSPLSVPLSAQLSLPVIPAKLRVAVIASRSAWRPTLSEPSALTIATCSMASIRIWVPS